MQIGVNELVKYEVLSEGTFKIFVVRTIFEEDTINTIIDNRLIVYDLKTKERKDIYLKTEDSVFDKLFSFF